MQMRNLLRLMGSLALTTGAATSAVACGEQAAVNLDTVLKNKDLGEVPVADITKPTDKELKDAIKAVPENKDINLNGIIVKAIVPESGPIVSATVTPDGKIYKGDEITVEFTLVVAKPDIKDVKVADLNTAVNAEKTFDELNTDKTITDAVSAAIKEVTKVDVSVGTDFTLTNDKNKEDKQAAGVVVTFTVTAKGDKISGEFTFTDTLE